MSFLALNIIGLYIYMYTYIYGYIWLYIYIYIYVYIWLWLWPTLHISRAGTCLMWTCYITMQHVHVTRVSLPLPLCVCLLHFLCNAVDVSVPLAPTRQYHAPPTQVTTHSRQPIYTCRAHIANIAPFTPHIYSVQSRMLYICATCYMLYI